jgi:hypothetical protein
MLKLGPGVLSGEPPGSGSFGLVALSFQGGNLSCESRLISDTPVQALVAKHTELNLRHPFGSAQDRIEPAAMLGSVVELQTPEYPPGLLGRESFVQGGGAMSVEVVQHHSDPLCLGVRGVRQPLHLVGKSFMVRLSVTATCRQPLWGSKNRNKFLVPLR